MDFINLLLTIGREDKKKEKKSFFLKGSGCMSINVGSLAAGQGGANQTNSSPWL